MKSRMVAIARAFAALMLLCMLATAGHALAQPRTYTYGGSANDILSEIAVSPDGRILILGQTRSTDGTMTGRVSDDDRVQGAFALCVDVQGESLWKLFEQDKRYNTFCAAAFDADGSVTFTYNTSSTTPDEAISRTELLRISRDGEPIARRTLLSDSDVGGLEVNSRAFFTDAGYIVAVNLIPEGEDPGERDHKRYYLFSREGDPLGVLTSWGGPGLTRVVTRSHMLREHEGLYTLFATDKDGGAEAVSRLTDPEYMPEAPGTYAISPWDMISQPDGGALTVGNRRRNGQSVAWLMRWDARGQVVADREYGAGVFRAVAKTDWGFAVTALVQEGEARKWVVLLLGEDGDILGSILLEDEEPISDWYWTIAQLPDGSLAVAGTVYLYQPGINTCSNVRLMIIEPDDLAAAGVGTVGEANALPLDVQEEQTEQRSFVTSASEAEQTWVFGGSKSDVLYEMAASGDGRIVMVGYTASSDGTLSSRTKTGRSGWALCVDTQGNVLWSFCSRLGTYDTFTAPVFHEDGSVTVVLEAQRDGRQELELIRLDAQGEVLLRKTMLLTGDGVGSVALVQATDSGYILGEQGGSGITVAAHLFGWDGERIGDVDIQSPAVLDSEYARAQSHVIRHEGGAGWLFAVDGQGNETRLAQVMTVREDGRILKRYDALVSLEDGGAAGCGWVNDGDVDRGILTRWNAQGERVFEWWMGDAVLMNLVRTERGFAATAYPIETEENRFASEREWRVIFFDEDGMRTGEISLGTVARVKYEDAVLRELPDGSLAVVSNVWVDGQDGAQADAKLTIIPKEEIV